MSEDTGMSKRGYHHGNLKQALIKATVELVMERGPQAFTLAETAKRAGVSTAAPYRHFRSKEDLLAEAARQGFEIFADLMEFAYERGHPSPLSAIEATSRAYLAFAEKYPGHYIAMFESGVSINANPDLAHAALRAKAVSQRASEVLVRRLPEHKRPPAAMISDHIWAMSHGVVELFARGQRGSLSQFSADALLETGVGIYLRGLGVIEIDE